MLACFRSFAEIGGYFLDDFAPKQFTILPDKKDPKGSAVYLVDGPRALRGPAANASRAVGDGPDGKLLRGGGAGGGRCRHNSDCPHTKPKHCCCEYAKKGDACETGSAGAPEARGRCVAGACAPVTAKTHVFDVASRGWLLPLVVHEGAANADDAARRVLKRLVDRMRAPDPADRPAFSEAIADLDALGAVD